MAIFGEPSQNVSTIAILAPVIGTVLVAGISAYAGKLQRSASRSATAAKLSETTAADYAEALKAKDALIHTLEQSSAYCEAKVHELEKRLIDQEEIARAASALERALTEENAHLLEQNKLLKAQNELLKQQGAA